jgi:hypothetical protein
MVYGLDLGMGKHLAYTMPAEASESKSLYTLVYL